MTCVTKCCLSVAFLPSRAIQKGYAESAFHDTCRTSSDVSVPLEPGMLINFCVVN